MPSHQKQFVFNILEELRKEFPVLTTPLYYSQPHELAIAVILSAQCTDAQVNKITPALFETFPSLKHFAEGKRSDIEKYVFSTGFYKNKAKNIQQFARQVLYEHDGKIPRTMKELLALSGIGRKTANVILQELYNINIGVVVDTHVSRITQLWQLSINQDPIKIEKDLMLVTDKKDWRDLSLLLIFLGRKYCGARKKLCDACCVAKICPAAELAPK